MANLYPNLLAPVRVAGHLLKNRIISGPSKIFAYDQEPYPTEKSIRFFEDRAKAGAALVTCAGVSVGNTAEGVDWWDIFKPRYASPLHEMAERIHMHGAKCTMELQGEFFGGYTVSDGCSIMGGPGIGREIPKEIMEKYKEDFINTAAAVMKCGFDGVMLHMGHSIPLAQFLSPLTNKRTDEYGGCTENRCRYPLEIISGVRQAIGKNAILEVRISGNEFAPGGIDLEEGRRIGALLQKDIDILQVSGGMHNPDYMTVCHPCGFLPPNPNVQIAEAFKKSGRITECLISTIGGIGSLADANAIVAEGKADFVVAVRAFIADPGWVRKGAAGRQEDVSPCIKCMRCHDSTVYQHHFICAVNPKVGIEQAAERLPEPAARKKVAVIGGGPAGMQAAITASERGHLVTLFEKAGKLGGKLNFADHVSFKYPLANYKNWLVSQVKKAGVDVRLNANASPDALKGYDAVIAAIGSEPVIPPIPGVENALIATDIYGDESALANTIAVIGGGEVGVETALHLARLGKKVTILEMRSEIAPDASPTHRGELLFEMRQQENIEVVLDGRCTGIDKDGVTYVKDGEACKHEAESVILSVGMRPLTALADSFMGIADEFSEIGDCVKVGPVENATKTGWYAAMQL